MDCKGPEWKREDNREVKSPDSLQKYGFLEMRLRLRLLTWPSTLSREADTAIIAASRPRGVQETPPDELKKFSLFLR